MKHSSHFNEALAISMKQSSHFNEALALSMKHSSHFNEALIASVLDEALIASVLNEALTLLMKHSRFPLWCATLQVFRGAPHAWYPQAIEGYPDGFPIWLPRNLTADRHHFLFAYLVSSNFLGGGMAAPDELSIKVSVTCSGSHLL